MTLRNAFADLAQEHVNSAGDAHLISGSKVKYRREFNDATLADWDVVEGAGQDVVAGTGVMTITTGTTANAETTVTTKQAFTAPFKAAFGFKISQKITNQEFYLEVVAENDDGTIDETVVAAWRIAGADSTTTSIARYEARNGGTARLQSANTATQATQTSDAVYEIVLESDEVWFHSKTADSTGARFASYMRNTVAPDPNRKYRLRYRVKNGPTAPASSTTMTAAFATCVDYTEQQVEVTGGAGSIGGAQAIPVYATGGSVSGNANGYLAASTSATGTTIAKVLAAASANNTLVKSSAARLYGYHLANVSAAWRYVKVYNKSSAPVAGTDTPALSIPIPPGQVVEVSHTIPVTFATGLGYALVTGPADNDASAVAANDVVGHLLYA